jgi:hypothetical protein
MKSTPTLTDTEMTAIQREIDYLDPHTTTDASWRAASLAGPCFCAGGFQCTRCQFQAEEN